MLNIFASSFMTATRTDARPDGASAPARRTARRRFWWLPGRKA